MPLTFLHLDGHTRPHITSEIQRDITAGMLYMSDNLSPQGRADYPSLLLASAESGDDSSLAERLRTCLNSHEKPRQLKSGGFSQPPVMRSNAHELLAEGEFNRFYMRGLCIRAIAGGVIELIVCRAKEVTNPRQESQQKIGQAISAEALLNDLRTRIGLDTILGIPPGPNSGLCVRLP